MKTILILGGTGFIGSHLCEYLLNMGHKVNVIDNYSTGRSRNLESVIHHDNLNLYNYDAHVHVRHIEKLISDCDYIYHLAGSVGVKYVENNPNAAMINNIQLELDIFKYVEKYNIPLLFASTSEVYGNSLNVPFKEDDSLLIGNPTQHRWGYSCSKLMGEFVALSSQFPSVIVRFFNVVGPRQLSDYGMVIPKFVKAILNNEDIIIYGDGEQTRCFCHIDDAVIALHDLLFNENCHNNIYNIGNPNNEMTIKQLANTIINSYDSKSKISYTPYNEVFSRNSADIIHRIPCIDKIQNDIDWTPTKTIDTIIKDVIAYEK